jgi:hypothetical protein
MQMFAFVHAILLLYKRTNESFGIPSWTFRSEESDGEYRVVSIPLGMTIVGWSVSFCMNCWIGGLTQMILFARGSTRNSSDFG